MAKLFYIAMAVIVIIFGLGIYATIWLDNAPCSELGDFSIRELPARCLNYYQNK